YSGCLFALLTLKDWTHKISGYLGHNITLPSGVDPSWILTRIEWSVFSNTTWIATYYNGKINTDRLSQYKGRLSLDKTSGDLTIHNLNTKDAREYTVNLINNGNQSIRKIELTVKRKCQDSSKEGCWMQVHCSTPDKGVTFHWEVNPPSVLTYSRSKQDGNVPLLVAFLSTSQNPVNFTCTCSTETQNASTVFTSKCDGKVNTVVI
uniref:Immunoglobulin domain-containing protein n=1 Tax=Mastacembelus armatus TaxID=205130 RepID=A0A3Q3MBT9_9TELE